MKLTHRTKVALTVGCLCVAMVGFMVKLPHVFRHCDKELHTLFYFIAAGFFNVLFAKRNVIAHVAIFAFLYLFGIGIEYAQAFSNVFLHKRIHGRYDAHDVQANVKGLLLFSVLWLTYVILSFGCEKLASNKKQ